MSEFLSPPPELPAKQRAIRARCLHPTGHFVEFAKEEIEQSISDRFEEQAARYSERLAIKTRKRRLTYGDLSTLINRVAQAVLDKRGEGPEPIALLFEQDAAVFAAILGVLKAGKIYVPMHPSYPPARLRALLENSESRLIITNGANLSTAREIASGECQLIDFDELADAPAAEERRRPISPESIAYILYTSGSTGEPKGVVQTHRNILHKTMSYTNDFHFCTDDRIALLSLSTFSLSVGFIFGAVLNGACLYPMDVREESLEGLANWLIEERITVYNSVPTLFRSLGAVLCEDRQFPELRLIHLGGEPVTSRDVEIYKRYFSQDCIFLHHLGSNETGTIAQYFMDKATLLPSRIVPAGYSDGDTEILLLDEHGQRVGYNQPGEITVKSRRLSPGYWRNPQLTRTVFLPDPDDSDSRTYLTGDLGLMFPDGCLTHLGRKDFRTKIRGNRVEIAEIELALLSFETIKEAVVVAREDTADNKRIVAYIVPMKAPPPTAGELRRLLKQKIPEHMMPAAFVFLTALPLTENGKVDRRALPAPSPARPDLDVPYRPPRTPIEEQLAQIWSDILGLDEVGVDDNFLELGGHSLAASQIISRVTKSFQLEVPVQLLFQSPTVAEMATLIAQSGAKTHRKEDFESILAEVESLPEQEAEHFFAQETADPCGKRQ